MMDDNRGKVLFVLIDSAGTCGPLYRQLFPDLRNATFFVSQPGETFFSLLNSTQEVGERARALV